MDNQGPEQDLSVGQLETACLLTSAPTISVSENYDSTDMIANPANSLQIPDDPEVNMTSIPSSRQASVHAVRPSGEENSVQVKVSDPSHIIHSVNHPIILGNINAANILPTAFIHRPNDNTLSQEASVSAEYGGSNFQGVLPLLIQQDLGGRNPDTVTSTPLLCLSSQNSFTSCSVGDRKQRLSENVPVSEVMDIEGKADLVGTDSEASCKPALMSSDTLLLSSALSLPSDALSINSVSVLSEDSITKTILSKEKSLFSIDKPFSLLSDISDRSVSLESIPSVSVFNPSANNAKVINAIGTISACDKISPPNTLLSSSTLANAGVAVLGGHRIPQSVFLLVKQAKAPASSVPADTAAGVPPQEKSNMGSKYDNCDKLPLVLMDFQSSSQEETSNQQLQTAVEDKNDTDTELTDNEDVKQDSLTRSDTVILETDKPSSSRASQLIASEETLILSEEEKSKQPEEPDRLSEGFSFKTLSTLSASTPESSSHVSDNASTDSKSFVQSASMGGSQLPNLSRIPLSIVLNSSTNNSVNDVFLSYGDGQVPMLRCLSGDLLDISGLLQMGQYNNAFIMPGSQQAVASAVTVGEAQPVQVSAKETQTDIVLGTNAVFFHPSNLTSNSESEGSDASHATLVNVTPSAHSSNIPATVIMTEEASTGNAEPFLQPVSCSEIYSNQCNAQDAISSEEPAVEDAVEAPCLFPCVNCEETFKSKMELTKHERTHKKTFKCDLCNASFTRMGNFTRHRKIHNLQSETQNVYNCDVCGREFLQRCDLKRHLLIHAKQEPYRCEKCGKGYVRRSDLVVHMRFHNKDRAFKCSSCDKKFFQTGDLNRHVRRAHRPNSQLTCGHCDRKYACETTLIRHMKASHKDIILRTVHQKLQETDSSTGTKSTSCNKVLFTMTEKQSS
ncbi:serendipity locus protein H-1 [Aplysia californica]|uniref:Serendipity locus protein H-1 n=1 Tax=Aplysia californica TaxID=6500 RepID=A0ABM0JF07_APLCA|nr:serendipity locus protein H-1 [Aplysia californica]XP_005092208.1 serendipity locus protein H-1 [Aplysia californica]